MKYPQRRRYLLMSSLQLLGKVRRKIISTINRRDVELSGVGPVVSFTFDDFPQSALRVGGSILCSYDACGTFYTSLGLMGQTNDLGKQFCADDLQALLQDGHELGSHTFGHLSSRSSALSEFEADVWRGREAVEQISGQSSSHHFSYPYGHVSFRAKPRIGAYMSSCRGITPGINDSPADLNLLRANSIYSSSFDLNSIDQLLALNEERRGWTIFYTHDISMSPSAYGCTPAEFEDVVKLAIKRNAKILPVGQVMPSAAL
jgi:peptidoglycan/xylan/chitin deacetylase (PgdA/CDA1 family)